jgi:hypothetical protein
MRSCVGIPEDRVPSYEQTKWCITEITRVVPIMDHMCPNSCIAFTGPFAGLEICPECGESHYNSLGATRQELHTMPLGPQLQALFRDPKVPKICLIGTGRQKRSCRNLSRTMGSRRLSTTSWMAKITLKLSEQGIFRRTILSSCYLLMVPSSIPTNYRIVRLSSGLYSITFLVHITRRHKCL